MYLYNRSDNVDDTAQALLDFAISSDADAVIAKSGFIDLGIERRSQGETDPRRIALASEAGRYDIASEGVVLNELLEEMGNYDRLSTTFRFRTGSSRLDERGRLDLDRLIAYLDGAPAGTEVTVVGFTDDVGPFEANRQLAIERANSVLEEIRTVGAERLDGINLSTMGFGEAAPSACNISDRGRAINRRVEIWISGGNA
jgi:phosphate transport system substrate-binding protein